jgi:cobalt-zinc-cadmium efflux system membrane fusion protein
LIGGGSMIELPATIESDPQGTQLVSAAIGGRVVALSRNLGQPVRRGETLAVIESREAATMNAEIEAARARLALAQSNLAREQRLFAQRVSPEQDLIAARTAATEARIALRLAQQQRAAAGGGGGGLNRLGIVAPMSGQIISRSVVLGQTVAADAELYRVANLSNLSLSLSLQAADAGRVRPGSTVAVTAPGRQGSARISFVSPALDPDTRLVPVIATIDNRSGEWRVGEPVKAAIQLSGDGGDRAIRVPSTAVQTVEGRPTVFVRTRDGFVARPVTIGGHAGAMTVIRSGLNGGEQIATVNSFTLKAELGKGEATHEDH